MQCTVHNIPDGARPVVCLGSDTLSPVCCNVQVDPDSGVVLSHKDVWDAVTNNQYLSIEAVVHVIRQVGWAMVLGR